jgi:hypothetical protein
MLSAAGQDPHQGEPSDQKQQKVHHHHHQKRAPTAQKLGAIYMGWARQQARV